MSSNQLDGDHMYAKKNFETAIAKKERELGRKLTVVEKAQVSALMNGKDNLRPMPAWANRSKRDSSATDWSQRSAKTSDSIHPE